MMKKELDVVGIIKSIKKLEAGVSVLMYECKKKAQLMHYTKQLYINGCTIFVNEQEEVEGLNDIPMGTNTKDYLFWEFCEEDDDKIIKD